MRTATTLVHPSTVDREDIVALFLDSAFAFRTTIGHLLPEAAVDDLLVGDLAVVRAGGEPAGLVGIDQMAEDHAGHYRIDVSLRQPHLGDDLADTIGAGVAYARSRYDVVRLTAIVPEHDLQTSSAYVDNGFHDEGVLRDVVARGRGRIGMRYLALVDTAKGDD